MASQIKVTIKSTDGSLSLDKTFEHIESNPSSEAIQHCESELMRQWDELYPLAHHTKRSISVKRVY